MAFEAKEWCERNGEDLSAMLLRCFFFGWVFRCSDFLLLAEEVYVHPDSGAVLMGPDVPKNCWFVYYLGHVRGRYTAYDYQAYAPYPLPYIAFQRRGRTHVLRWEKSSRDFNTRMRRRDVNVYERKVG